MRFVADLHVHSYLSRATSKDLNLSSLHRWAQRKGIRVVGTGDFTHPRWLAELRAELVPAEPGLYALAPALARAADEAVPPACRADVRFLLQVEISSIYRRGERVRKVHNLVYAPDFEAAARIATRLARIGNIESDGRPILGLDSRDLLEIVLESSPDAFLIPAHIWTPWFSVLGAQSGFDAIADCFGDLAGHVFAAETGLSSDPAMNWRLSQLDRLALVSNSDAHSAEKLGREANLFDCELSYFGLRDALRERREGFVGTVEFFPEEGKYHFDGHRKCGVSVAPRESHAAGGLCPRCGKRLTGGVMSRVDVLADRPEGVRPDGAKPFRSLVPLAEVLGEIAETGPASARVQKLYDRLLARVGPELSVLGEAPLELLEREGPPLLGEAVRRIRDGRVQVVAGFDGEYGVVRAFADDERRALLAQRSFGFAGTAGVRAPVAEAPSAPPAAAAAAGPAGASELFADASGLDLAQSRAVEHGEGPLLVVAGPGTGKTRTVAHRIARLVKTRRVSPRAIAAITFTRKAAAELAERLETLLGARGAAVTATTFHAFGLGVLRAFREPRGFSILDENQRREVVAAAALATGGAIPAGRAAELIAWAKAHLETPDEPVYHEYERLLAAQGALDFDDLVVGSVRLLESSEPARAWARERCRFLFVDEYQDINAAQYRLVRLLAPEPHANLCAVGDPDQAIYGFRGANPSYFARFTEDWPDATVVTLTRNYRSPAAIVGAATEVIARSPGRAARAVESARAIAAPVERVTVASERDEAEWIADDIERSLGGTSLYSIDSGRADGSEPASPLAFHDIAVLCRMHAQLEPIGEAMARAGIPCHAVGDDALTARPFVGEWIDQLRRRVAAAGGAAPVADQLFQLDPLAAEDPRRRRALELLAALAVPFGRDTAAFLAEVAVMRQTDVALEPQKVALLTLHAAKGLEFPLVFVAGCEDGLLPLRLPGRPPADVEEERRLLYVGMTRARRRLVLTGARQRTLLGRTASALPCPFLAGMPPELVVTTNAGGRRPRRRQLSLL